MVIENNKYILHTSCKLWDKQAEVLNSINLFKLHHTTDPELYTDEELDLYAFYCTQSKNKYNLLVSKQYYEKTVSDIICNQLDLVFP